MSGLRFVLVGLLCLACTPQDAGSRVDPIEPVEAATTEQGAALAVSEAAPAAEPLFAVVDEVAVAQRSGRTIVLLHGFGADEEDLLRLGRGVDPGASLVGLRAPLELGGGRYAWFPRGEGFVAGATLAARPRVVASLEALEATLGHPPGDVVVMGFSQGATMAVDLATHRPDLVVAAAGIGGWTAPDLEITPSATPTPIFVAHGDADPVVPIARGRALQERLEESESISLTWLEVPGMKHQITPAVVAALQRWLPEVP